MLSLSNDVVVSVLATSYQALSSPRVGMDDSMFLLEKNCFEFNVRGTVHRYMCILYNQRDATYTVFFIIIISAVHVSGGFPPIIVSL